MLIMLPGKLYKYIGFQRTEHWHQTGVDRTLHFSSLKNLQSGNDPDEFKFTFHHHGYFFVNHFNRELKTLYKKLFSNARVLCLSKSLNAELWAEYCGQEGGVCYEFETSVQSGDVSHNHVTYANKKNFNFPDYLISETKDRQMARLFCKTKRLTKKEDWYVLNWVSHSPEPREICLRHITNEIIWKKLNLFAFENEYRFIHPVQPIDKALRVELRDSKVTIDQLGLSLKRIYTSDIDKVRAKVGLQAQVEIIDQDF